VDISPEPNVIGQIPSHVVRVLVDDDLVGIPEPTIAIAHIKGCNAEKKSTEPKAFWTAASEMPYMPSPGTAGEMTMLPRVIEMVVGVPAPAVVPNPLAVVVNMRSLRVALNVLLGMGVSSRVRRRAVDGTKPPPTLSP
jgi:hypothetical protein